MFEQGALHPKKAKEGLAMRIIADFHDEQAAQTAREEFERIVDAAPKRPGQWLATEYFGW